MVGTRLMITQSGLLITESLSQVVEAILIWNIMWSARSLFYKTLGVLYGPRPHPTTEMRCVLMFSFIPKTKPNICLVVKSMRFIYNKNIKISLFLYKKYFFSKIIAFLCKLMINLYKKYVLELKNHWHCKYNVLLTVSLSGSF